MFNNFGIYQPTVLLVTVATITISLIICVMLTVICDPLRGTDYLAKQWKIYLAVGLSCTVMLTGYGYIDHKNVAQFQDEGQALQIQYIEASQTDASAAETAALAISISQYNDHLETLNKVFHFPSTKAILSGIHPINII